MVGIHSMTDFRNSESWNQARFAICAVLEFAEAWSRRIEYRSLAKNIEHLSVAVLDNIAKGYEGTGNKTFLKKAEQSIRRLENELHRVHRKGALKQSDATLLKLNLDSVKASLTNLER